MPDDHESEMPGTPNGEPTPASEERRDSRTLSLARWRKGVKRTFSRATLALVTALVAAAAGAGSGSATPSPVVGHVYVNDNTAVANTVAGFDRHADGSLTPISGSPFATGGVGTGATIASQGALQISDDGRYLLAVDAGSNEISVLRIAHDGAVRQIHGGTVLSGGLEPVSIAVHRRLVYVAE